jgi:outer membrane protein OmpA-like peptidoglycan-associated protein
MESSQVLTQTSLADLEQKLAAALESKNTLQNQLNDREAAVSGAQNQLNELQTKVVALNDEKVGLASRLSAVLAELQILQPLKTTRDEKAAALAAAEAKLQELPVLQAKIDELGQTLQAKEAALVEAGKQAEQIAGLEAQLAQSQAKFQELSVKVEESAAKIAQVETEKTELAAQLAEAQAKAAELATLRQELEEKNNALKLVETQIKEATTAAEQIKALEVKLNESSLAAQALQTAKEEAESKAAQAAVVIVGGKETVTRLETELTQAQEQIKELLDKRNQQVQQDLVPNLEQQIATLREQLAQVEAAGEQAKKELAEATAAMTAKVEEARAEKETLQQSLNACQVSITELQGTLHEVQQSSATKEEAKAQPEAQPAAEATAAKPEPDGDKDGVADALDLCPNSPAGASVNAIGCAPSSGMVLEGVNFRSGTADLLPEARTTLDKVAATLGKLTDLKVEVAGHTDAVGNPDLNQRLSVARAEAVVRYLTGKGVPADRLVAKGYGQDKPIADNTTPAGKRKNRRVELQPLAQ